ncbi:MAG: FAD-dependent oxidoreductase, partial [Candidatus Neomarinimicrobiota bacterium]
FRLPDDAIAADLAAIERLGVRIHLNRPVDGPRFRRLRAEHDYVYVAVGARRPRRLDISGENAAGVHEAIDFLTRARGGDRIALGARVLVIGGGNSAVDAARTARRLVDYSGTVTVVYRRTRLEMPVGRDEAESLDAEGIELVELVAPVAVNMQAGKVTGLTGRRMRLGEPEADGRRRPVPIPDSEFDLPADDIIVAVGQESAVDFLRPSDLEVNPVTHETRLPGIYAGGDVVRGAGSLINAIADGQRVAQSIIGQAGQEHGTVNGSANRNLAPVDYQVRLAVRVPAIQPPSPSGELTFEHTSSTFDTAAAQTEAARCLLCDDYCNICVTVCPNRAMVAYEAKELELELQRAVVAADGQPEISASGTFRRRQRYQVLNITDLCNECGNCTTFCPTAGRPYEDKPRLCLTERSFEMEDDCFYLDGATIRRRVDGVVDSLTDQDDCLVYENAQVRARLDRDTLRLLDVQPLTAGTVSLDTGGAAIMFALLESLRGDYLFNG